ncbi:hypothetical protein EXIGLDRAFT_3898 [Exidia glandulosa HHB12029]|uniref:C2H2-type domain-containing protein n=1 Tax=Exidia glandulosa HHB12029 TaxID=1314781 RepID=A0A165QLZ1_EXIGL|nr:hypothetical protein EXIGLDRAFT_3898 [Exidia glandulosa HHB12029]
MDDPFAAFLDGSLAPDASVVTEPSLPFNGHFSAQGSCVDPAALYAQLAPSQMVYPITLSSALLNFPPAQDGILHFGHVDAVEDDAVFDANLSAYDAEDSEDDTCDVDHVVPKVEPTPEQLPRAESDNKKGGSVEVPETVPDAEPDMSDDGDDGDGEYHPHSGRAPTRVLRPRAAARRKASNPYPSPAPSRGEDDSEHGIQCQKCVRRFKRPAELVRHASLHLPVAEQTVVCGICDKAFKGKRKDALRRHQMSTRACLDLQEQYSDKELEAMGCVTRAGRANSRSRT